MDHVLQESACAGPEKVKLIVRYPVSNRLPYFTVSCVIQLHFFSFGHSMLFFLFHSSFPRFLSVRWNTSLLGDFLHSTENSSPFPLPFVFFNFLQLLSPMNQTGCFTDNVSSAMPGILSEQQNSPKKRKRNALQEESTNLADP